MSEPRSSEVGRLVRLGFTEPHLKVVLENALEYAIFSTDLGRRITTSNVGAQRLLGYSSTEATGMSADAVFTDEDRAAGAPEAEARTALEKGRAADEREHQRKDGSRFFGSGVLMLMRDAGGNAIGFLKILRDATAPLPQPPK